MIWLLAATLAQAGDVALWTKTTWPDGADVKGADGWEGGYGGDKWSAIDGGELLVPRTTDENQIWERDWQADKAADNWLARGAAFTRGGVEATIGNRGDSGIGVVLQVPGEGMYLAFQTEDRTPPDVSGKPVFAGNWRVLVFGKVKGKRFTQLGRTESIDRIDGDSRVALRMERRDDRFIISFDGDVLFDVTDADPLGPSRAGVWAYGNGLEVPGWFQGASPALFDSVSAFLVDIDDDGVADQDDNCVDTANADQVDLDMDDIGDVCDPTPPVTQPGDSGDSGPSGGDTGSPGDTGVDGDTGVNGPGTGGQVPGGNGGSSNGGSNGSGEDFDLLYPNEAIQAGCAGCAGTAAPSPGWLLLLGGLGALRRRQR